MAEREGFETPLLRRAYVLLAGNADIEARMASKPSIDANALAQFCRTHKVTSLSLFGSRLKGTARRDSDVDLLAEFAADATPSLLDMARMEIELSELLGGLTVDLRTADELSRYFRQEVVDSAELLHAA
jgi:predicted nucleotidyltransferase